jgi:hypothetical protein
VVGWCSGEREAMRGRQWLRVDLHDREGVKSVPQHKKEDGGEADVACHRKGDPTVAR